MYIFCHRSCIRKQGFINALIWTAYWRKLLLKFSKFLVRNLPAVLGSTSRPVLVLVLVLSYVQRLWDFKFCAWSRSRHLCSWTHYRNLPSKDSSARPNISLVRPNMTFWFLPLVAATASQGKVSNFPGTPLQQQYKHANPPLSTIHGVMFAPLPLPSLDPLPSHSWPD